MRRPQLLRCECGFYSSSYVHRSAYRFVRGGVFFADQREKEQYVVPTSVCASMALSHGTEAPHSERGRSCSTFAGQRYVDIMGGEVKKTSQVSRPSLLDVSDWCCLCPDSCDIATPGVKTNPKSYEGTETSSFTRTGGFITCNSHVSKSKPAQHTSIVAAQPTLWYQTSKGLQIIP